MGPSPSRRPSPAPSRLRRAPRCVSPPDAPRATELPSRFSFRKKGASVEVLDGESGRLVRVPKSATPVVALILNGLFSDVAAPATDANAWLDALPARHAAPGIRLVMERMTVAVDPAHPNKVLGPASRHPEGYAVHAYVIKVANKPVGHLIMHAERRMVLVAPALQEVHSPHNSFGNAVLRIEITAKGLRDRKAAGAGRAVT